MFFPKFSNISRGCGLSKFNNSLVSNTNFVDEMKPLIQNVNLNFEIDTYLNDQVKWELLKYEIRKFPINFSGKLAHTSGTLQTDSETKIKNLEENLTNKNKFNEYKTVKDELENVFDNIATGVKIGSKCDW